MVLHCNTNLLWQSPKNCMLTKLCSTWHALVKSAHMLQSFLVIFVLFLILLIRVTITLGYLRSQRSIVCVFVFGKV